MSARRRRRRGSEANSDNLSAAQRYRDAKARAATERSHRGRYQQTLSYILDDFQQTALASVEDGHNVLVAAPTGAGKTVVGEFACYLALQRGERAFYTTPMKALSNQKYRDLGERFGSENVGLLTGDVAINAQAPVIVMTTEVARNMIYAGKDLSDLGFVVLDEVHYLADKFRGPVWEEVLILMPENVRAIALSATVSNAEEFGDWIGHVRNGCDVIISEVRPVPLRQHMLVGRTLHDLYVKEEQAGGVGPSRHSSQINPQLRSAIARASGLQSRSAAQRERQLAGGRRMRNVRRRSVRSSRPEVAITLDRSNLLPGIYFIFSRAGCDEAVQQVVSAGIELTSEDERRRIRALVEPALETLPASELKVLRAYSFAQALEMGVAAHHAGMLPLFKEIVEKLFSTGLVKLVFATETLALGINMPARSVVLESLTKYNGHSHVGLTAGEYTQLTGRAGRRGIDTLGHAVVVYRDEIEPALVSALASKRSYPLISAFAPTYNMVANLAAAGSLEQARSLVERSFAQFQTDRQVVELARQAKEAKEKMEAVGRKWECSKGDAQEYVIARDELALLQKRTARSRNRIELNYLAQELLSLRVGDVISIPDGGGYTDAVVTRADNGSGTIQIVYDGGGARAVGPAALDEGFAVVGRMRLPSTWLRAVGKYKGLIAKDLRYMRRQKKLRRPKRMKNPLTQAQRSQIQKLENLIRSHPVHQCEHRDMHAREAKSWLHARRDYQALNGQVRSRTSSLGRRFDAVVQVLQQVGCMEGTQLTPTGQLLRRIYAERDLVLALALDQGIWDELDPAQLAAVVSACVFESRKDHLPDTEIPGGVSGKLGKALNRTQQIMGTIQRAEAQARTVTSAPLETGLVSAMYWWVQGDDLATTVRAADLEAGDWVRWCRQVVDVLHQIQVIAGGQVATNAQWAIQSIRRSVVSVSEPGSAPIVAVSSDAAPEEEAWWEQPADETIPEWEPADETIPEWEPEANNGR
ncbi:MAG: DEAD/DEAH box helicase [Actinomycetaceae bacterium]|nr:DEAD/DEAH box helicase [Actinomycetaceae bacterium]